MRLTKREINILLFLAVVAIARFLFSIPERLDYKSALGKEVSVTGIVTDYPDKRLNNQRLTITPINKESSILAVVSLSKKISYGDEVKVRGILKEPENFETDIGKEFDYKGYLSNKNIYYIIDDAGIEILSKGNGSKLISILYKFRESFIKNIEKVLVSPQSDLASGLVLGVRGGFDKETRDNFIKTGTIHIIALSGYNVTIVAENLMKIFGYVFRQNVSIFFGIFSIILFVLLSGASATAIRAGIMASIALFARLTGRTYDAGRALIIAGLLMIAYDVRVIFDISFQLSFLATVGVLFITPKVLKWFWFIPQKLGLRDIISTTVGATIIVLPLLLYSTGILSIVSLPANILILPLIPITMLFIFITGALGFLHPALAMPFGYIAHALLSYILSIIDFFSNISFASVTIKSFPVVVTIVLYILIFWWVFKKEIKKANLPY